MGENSRRTGLDYNAMTEMAFSAVYLWPMLQRNNPWQILGLALLLAERSHVT